MKRLAILGGLCCGLALSMFCTHLPPVTLPGVITIYAQTLPVTRTAVWTPNAASDAVTNYTVRLDGTTVGSPTAATQSVTFTTLGAHTVTVTATNIWGTSGPLTLTVNVVAPSTPTGLVIQ